jgi:SOS-response transcriptional repressor LexA
MQEKAFAVVRAANASGRAPSLEEIKDALGLKSRTTVRAHIMALEQKGYLRPRRFGATRDIYAADLAA